MLIDGVEITSINLQEARRSMAVINQDSVLFGGTLKRKHGPLLTMYGSTTLGSSGGCTRLKTVVQDLPEQLNLRLRESGRNLSVGERQLLCLARELVQRSKIIVMDEATAKTDHKTDHKADLRLIVSSRKSFVTNSKIPQY